MVASVLVSGTFSLPGFVNSHSHAFQRALRGRAAGTDFWTWRDGMLEEADRATPDVGAGALRRRLPGDARRRLHGGRRVPLPRRRRGIRRRRGGGRGRDRDRAAPRRLRARRPRRACASRRSPPTWRRSSRCAPPGSRSASPPTPCAPAPASGSRRSAATPRARGCRCTSTPTSSRARSQECLEEHDCRPIELLADAGCLTARTTIVHATHADDDELDLLAATGARICACPTTEADLGDGFLRVAAVRERSIPLCIGSDSNMRIDPLEELRELEGIARRQSGTARHLLDRRAARDRLGRGRRARCSSTTGRRSRSTSATARSRACRRSTSRRR